MWNKISIIYLISCTCILSLLSMLSSGGFGQMPLVILTTSLSYPVLLAWMRPKTGFWRGLLQLLIILSVALFVALLSGFIGNLLAYVNYEHLRLGREFKLSEVLGWYFGESPAFFLYLVVMPVAIIVPAIGGVCYTIGYFASFQLFRLIRSYSDSENSGKATAKLRN